MAAAPFGSSLILPISYAYIALMGSEGLTEVCARCVRLHGHNVWLLQPVSGAPWLCLQWNQDTVSSSKQHVLPGCRPHGAPS